MSPTVTVVICSRDRPDFLHDALEAIRVGAAECDVVVVDSASVRPKSVASVAKAAGARLVRCERPGVSHARNAGVAATEADVVAFTDDDCLPAAGWVAAVSRAFANHPDVAFVCGRVDVGPGDGEPLSVLVDPLPRELLTGTDPRDIGHGANLAVRRPALLAVGGFDEQMGPGTRIPAAEDTDLMWRLLRSGRPGRYDPAVVVAHRAWRPRSAALRAAYRYGVGEGALDVKRRRVADARPTAVRSALGEAGGHLRARYRFGVASSCVRAAGALVGRTIAGRQPMAGDRFLGSR